MNNNNTEDILKAYETHVIENSASPTIQPWLMQNRNQVKHIIAFVQQHLQGVHERNDLLEILCDAWGFFKREDIEHLTTAQLQEAVCDIDEAGNEWNPAEADEEAEKFAKAWGVTFWGENGIIPPEVYNEAESMAVYASFSDLYEPDFPEESREPDIDDDNYDDAPWPDQGDYIHPGIDF